MFEKILKGLFSMKAMAVSMIIFAVAIGRATFIESDFGTPASKIAIYNARWFEFLLLHLSITLIVNIVHHKMYLRDKWPTFIFHISFLLMIIGAGVTRYLGFEGQMRIGIGEKTNVIYSSTPYFSFKANDLVNQYMRSEKRWLSEGVENPFSFSYELPNQPKVKVEYVSYKEDMIDTLVEDKENGRNVIELVVRGESRYLFEGEETYIGALNFSFEKENPSIKGVEISEQGGLLFIYSNEPYRIVDMTGLSVADRAKSEIDPSAISIIPADTLVPFYPNQLYMIGSESFAFRGMMRNVRLEKVKTEVDGKGSNYLTLRLSTGSESKMVDIDGSPNHIIQNEYFQFAGQNFEVSYGAIPIQIPFYVECRDFQLDTYPGSEMPSSYASEVTVIDSANNVNREQRIFMNNFMDYGGYRFFQSSYFSDRSGTVLSVNYDWYGMVITYIAYFLMGLGMFFAVINPKGRVAELNNLIKKSRDNRAKMLKTIVLIFGLSVSGVTFANDSHSDSITDNNLNSEQPTEFTTEDNHNHDHHHDHDHHHNHEDIGDYELEQEFEIKYLSEEYADKLNDLLVQDYDGRTIPFHTLADKLLRKIHQKDHFEDKSAVQTLVAMLLYGPVIWNDVEIVFVSSKIRNELGVGKYVSVKYLEDSDGIFKWMDDYQAAYGKADAQKNEYDKQLIKLGERYRIIKEIFQFSYFRVVPIPDDANGTWVWPFSRELKDKDPTGNRLSINLLHNLFKISEDEKTFEDARPFLDSLKVLQWQELRKYEAKNPLMHKLTQRHVEVEIAYNKLKIFDKIQTLYFTFGFSLIILFFIRTLITPTIKRESIIKKISFPVILATFIVFIVHGGGLGMRWYITGHAPWSDGYEAIIFISWATILAGLFFVKKNPAVIAVTVLLSAMMLFVTELNLMDPEITPLEPVLQSYWLMIHVAIITSSYGFLGISSVIGILNLVLYLLKNNKNKKRLQMNIIELTSVSEIVIIIGLFLLSAGTFIGGVWANESWGRYWGWDPKEVWALVSMLVYATIIHLRWIPALNNRFLFNVLSIWGYASILFTFFGVNFILVGLHSYAQGDGVAEWPVSVIVSICMFAAFTVLATIKYLSDEKKGRKKAVKTV